MLIIGLKCYQQVNVAINRLKCSSHAKQPAPEDIVTCTGVYVLFLPPAEHTLVRTGQAGRGLHTAVRLDPVKRVFITASSAP